MFVKYAALLLVMLLFASTINPVAAKMDVVDSQPHGRYKAKYHIFTVDVTIANKKAKVFVTSPFFSPTYCENMEYLFDKNTNELIVPDLLDEQGCLGQHAHLYIDKITFDPVTKTISSYVEILNKHFSLKKVGDETDVV